MSIKSLSQEEIELKLLRGDSFTVDKFTIEPVTLSRVVDLGYRNFNTYLGVISSDVKDVVDLSASPELEKYTLYDIYLHSGNEELIRWFVDGLSWFIGEDPNDLSYVPDFGLVYGGITETLDDAKLIGKEIFAEIVKIIKLQCGIEVTVQKEFDASDAKAQEIINALKQGRDAIDKHSPNTKESTDEIHFADLVSAVATKSNGYSLFNIWELTFPQFYNVYKRLEKISSYEVGILASVNGAKVDLQHWSAPFNKSTQN